MQQKKKLIIHENVSNLNIILCFKNRDSAASKQIIAIFEKISTKVSKKLSVSAQSCTHLQDHLLPMMQVQERASLDIVCQVFNFIDTIGGLDKLTADTAEQFLAARGIIKSDKEQNFDEKQKEMYKLCNDSSYMDTENLVHLASETKQLAIDMAEDNEERIEVVFEEDCCRYKDELLKAFKGMVDPYSVEFTGDQFDYEQNPADPTHPSKTLTISPYEPIWD